jgi:hypothetical protein
LRCQYFVAADQVRDAFDKLEERPREINADVFGATRGACGGRSRPAL